MLKVLIRDGIILHKEEHTTFVYDGEEYYIVFNPLMSSSGEHLILDGSFAFETY